MSPDNRKRTLVLFYTRTGKTRTVAETVSETLGGRLQEIRDLKKRSGILGYIRSSLDVLKNRPTEIVPREIDLLDYDLIFIGSPVWGQKFAVAISTFLNSVDLTGKKVVLFVTMNMHLDQKITFDDNMKLIRSRGGRVIDTFFVKTFFKKGMALKQMTGRIISERADGWRED
jgi:flavodoxin